MFAYPTSVTSCAVGISIVGVELAVLLNYRTGWRIGILSVIGNTASALLLVSDSSSSTST
jgi:hypothetical protein